MTKAVKNKTKQATLGLPAEKQKMTGFDGKPLKVTTPKSIQEAADLMFDKKEVMENVKTALEHAVERVESEMRAENMDMVSVSDGHGKPYILRLKAGKTKLEVKAVK